MNKLGKMYQVKEYYWLLFPNKEDACGARPSRASASDHAGYWSKQLNCTLSYISPNDLVVLLEVDGKYKKLLTNNGEMGWTWVGEDDNFEEVKTKNTLDY